MVEIARDIFTIYAFTFATGWGLYDLTVPDFLKRRYLALILPAGLGLLQLSIVSGYTIYEASPIIRALPIALVIGASTLLIALIRWIQRQKSLSWGRRFGSILGSMRPRSFAIGTILAAVFIASMTSVLTPILRANMATTPYRIGIDQVGYAESAQFLVEGGTTVTARHRLLLELRTDDFKKAKAQSAKDNHQETYIDTEFLLKADRWGYPGTLAALTILTGAKHVFKIEFLMLIVNFALLLALVYYTARSILRLPSIYAFATMLAIAFNCNLLNVYYEGQLAEVFALPFFILIFILFIVTRSSPQSLADIEKFDLVRASALLAFLIANLFSAFNEALVLVFATVFGSLTLDILFHRRTNLIALSVLTFGFGAGFLIVFPFSNHWLSYTIANLSGLSRAGFWQPHWASFAEMIGLFDIYQTPGSSPQVRDASNAIANTVASVVAMFLILRLMLRERDIDRSFWLAIPALVLAEYVKSHYIDDILNYPYMKLYTMFVPLLGCLAMAGLYSFTRSQVFVLRLAPFVACMAIVVTGSHYIIRYDDQSGYVTRDMFSLYTFDGKRRFDRFALVTNHADIQQYMFAPLLDMHWADEKGDQKLMGPDLQRPVAVSVRQGDVPCRQCLARFFAGRIVYEDPTFLVIDTGMILKDLCSSDVAAQSLASLSDNPREVWRPNHRTGIDTDGSPYRQCDFGFVQKFLRRGSPAT